MSEQGRDDTTETASAQAAAPLRLAMPQITDADVEAVTTTLRSGWLSHGPQAQAFESELAAYIGAGQAVAVSSGTAALVLALRATGIGPGDEVIVPAFTFPATCNAVLLVGARPVLADVTADSWNLDPDRARQRITAATRAVLTVDLFGVPAAREPFAGWTSPAGKPITLIEDAACSLGSARQGVRCGADAQLACFSFHPRKILTTGEGGAVVCADAQLAHYLRQLRNHGRDDEGRFVGIGGNYRLSELGAAIGRSQLRRLDEMIEHRQHLADRYRERLAGSEDLMLQQTPTGTTHNVQTFAVCLARPERREHVMRQLSQAGIQTTIATYALAALEPYRELAAAEVFPVADQLWRGGLALPMHHELRSADVDRICAALLAAVT